MAKGWFYESFRKAQREQRRARRRAFFENVFVVIAGVVIVVGIFLWVTWPLWAGALIVVWVVRHW